MAESTMGVSEELVTVKFFMFWLMTYIHFHMYITLP